MCCAQAHLTAMNDRILIQGDSLPLPRQTVPYDETWPSHLRADARVPSVINRSQSGKTTNDLHTEKVRFPKRKLEAYTPASVVLQIGIVDCAPRLLSKTEKDLLTACPFGRLSRVGGHLLKRVRDRSRERTYVSEAAFETNLREFLRRTEELGVERVVIIKILTAGRKYTAKNPDVQAAIRDYNRIIEAVAEEFPNVETLRPLAESEAEEAAVVDDLTLNDGYHLDAAGHERVYERLLGVSSLGRHAGTTSAPVD